MKNIKLIFSAFSDLFILLLPKQHLSAQRKFAFLVHPRNIEDIYRKYGFFRYMPKNTALFIFNNLWPVKVSEIDGMKDKDGKNIKGVIIAVPLSAHQMLDNKDLAKKKVAQAVKLAEKSGASLVGLGAYTSSVTNGGKDIISNSNVFLTNGNALTSAISVKYLERVMDSFNDGISLSVVGATGSIGSAVVKILASHKNLKKLILVGRTQENLEKLREDVLKINKDLKVDAVTDISKISDSEIVFVGTSAKDALIRSENIKKDGLIYDITEPKNTSKDIMKDRSDIKLVDGGLVYAPNINCNFNFGLQKGFIFGCLAETMILSAEHQKDNYSIGKVEVEKVKKMMELSEKYNFK